MKKRKSSYAALQHLFVFLICYFPNFGMNSAYLISAIEGLDWPAITIDALLTVILTRTRVALDLAQSVKTSLIDKCRSAAFYFFLICFVN